MMPNKSCILSHVIVSKQAEQHDFIGHKFNAHTLCPYRVSAKWIKIFIPPPLNVSHHFAEILDESKENLTSRRPSLVVLKPSKQAFKSE